MREHTANLITLRNKLLKIKIVIGIVDDIFYGKLYLKVFKPFFQSITYGS